MDTEERVKYGGFEFPPAGAERRIVCAAARHKSGHVILSPRHHDHLFHRQCKKDSFDSQADWHLAEQGFVDQWGFFLDRFEAYEVAKAANQIRKYVGGNETGGLYSENLY